MVEIFRTKIPNKEESELTLQLLQQQFPYYDMNFDLEDRDKILRVENKKGHVASPELLNYARSLSLPITMWTEEESAQTSVY